MARALCVLTLLTLAACTHEPAPQHSDVVFEKIAPGVWLHTTYMDIPPYGPVRSNGLVVVTGNHATLIDTAWTDRQTRALVDWATDELRKPVRWAVLTHAHNDKMGGVGELHRRGIETAAHPLSNVLALQRGLQPASTDLELAEPGSTARVEALTVFYPGGGHTIDNIVVWHEASATLFGGCLIRPAAAKTLGNTADADIATWPDSVSRVRTRFPDVKRVVPSHGPPGGAALLEHTLGLARSAADGN